MEWSELKERVYYVDGFWRDIYVLNTSIEDWLKWKNMVEENFKLSVYYSKSNLMTDSIDISYIHQYWKGNGGYGASAIIDIKGMRSSATFIQRKKLRMISIRLK